MAIVATNGQASATTGKRRRMRDLVLDFVDRYGAQEIWILVVAPENARLNTAMIGIAATGLPGSHPRSWQAYARRAP